MKKEIAEVKKMKTQIYKVFTTQRAGLTRGGNMMRVYVALTTIHADKSETVHKINNVIYDNDYWQATANRCNAERERSRLAKKSIMEVAEKICEYENKKLLI